MKTMREGGKGFIVFCPCRSPGVEPVLVVAVPLPFHAPKAALVLVSSSAGHDGCYPVVLQWEQTEAVGLDCVCSGRIHFARIHCMQC